MDYKNIKTGAVISSSCGISGGDWVPIEPPKPAPAPATVKPKVEKKKPTTKRR